MESRARPGMERDRADHISTVGAAAGAAENPKLQPAPRHARGLEPVETANPKEASITQIPTHCWQRFVGNRNVGVSWSLTARNLETFTGECIRPSAELAALQRLGFFQSVIATNDP